MIFDYIWGKKMLHSPAACMGTHAPAPPPLLFLKVLPLWVMITLAIGYIAN